MIGERVSSIRSNQENFLEKILGQGGGCQIEKLKFDCKQRLLRHAWKRGKETEQERWRHRVLRLVRSDAPLSWQTGVTRHRCALYSGSWRSIFEPWSDLHRKEHGRIGGDRCLGILTQAVAQCAASANEPSGRPVSYFHFLLHCAEQALRVVRKKVLWKIIMIALRV